ncbi:MAG: hypothetical protein Kapaf2KO_07740 [Candidatus Kapaibacteriales bacterium]
MKSLAFFLTLFIPLIGYSQIHYNKSVPDSKTLGLSDKEPLFFYTDETGSLSEKSLDLDILKGKQINQNEDYSIVISKIKINTQIVGNMSIVLRASQLGDTDQISIYTSDYDIVAGPIFKSNFDEFLVIDNIPTEDLNIELKYRGSNEPQIKLEDIYFKPIKKLGYTKNSTDSCYTCPDYKSHQKNYNSNSLNFKTCEWFGSEYLDALFGWSRLATPAEVNTDASRASCIVSKPSFHFSCDTTTQLEYGGNGILLNFPHPSCTIDSCPPPVIAMSSHVGDMTSIHDATKNYRLTGSIQSKEWLDKVIVRFNWQYKYGVPRHLENVDCNSSTSAFNAWRALFDFDEVVDYCGVRSMAWGNAGVFQGIGPQISFITMNTEPSYKEVHLGILDNFKMDFYQKGGGGNFYLMDKTDILHVGRRNRTPTVIIEDIEFTAHPSSLPQESLVADEADDDYIYTDINDVKGFSGTASVRNDPLNSGSHLFYGMVHGFELSSGHTNFFKTFNVISTYLGTTKNYYEIVDECYNGTFEMKNLDSLYPQPVVDYFDELFFQFKRTSYPFNDTTVVDTVGYYRPSLEISDRCKFLEYATSSCDFNLSSYVTVTYGDSICVTIDSIPADLFPGDSLPKGFRLYSNYASQRTRAYKNPSDRDMYQQMRPVL